MTSEAKPAAVPDGWQLVPVFPTNEMYQAIWGMYQTRCKEVVDDLYTAMLAAAPTPPADASEVEPLKAENRRLKAELSSSDMLIKALEAKNERLKVEVKRLRKALKPFGESDLLGDLALAIVTPELCVSHPCCDFTYGDLAAARAALEVKP